MRRATRCFAAGGSCGTARAASSTPRRPPSAYALATSDDERALEIAASHPGVRAGRRRAASSRSPRRTSALDALVLALGDARVAIRRLELLVSPLESMFFALTLRAAPRSSRARARASCAEQRVRSATPRARHERARLRAPPRDGPSAPLGGEAVSRRLPGPSCSKLFAQLATPAARARLRARPVRVRGRAADPERHPVRRAVRRLGPLLRVRDLARRPRLRRHRGGSRDRRRARG